MNAQEQVKNGTSTVHAASTGVFDELDEVISTDTTEALREAAKHRADQEDEDNKNKRPPVPPMGVMALHLLQLVQFDQTLTEPDLLDPALRFKMMVSVGDIHKWTKFKRGHLRTVHEKDRTNKILTRTAVDEVKHFSVEIPQHIADSKNVVRIELYTTYANTQDGLELMGCAELHLHEIIRALMVIDVVPLSFNKRVVASLDIEFAFMYGAFGYGYSTQLENPVFEPVRDLSHSMFPRLELPPDRDGEVLAPRPQHPPAFVPWSCPIITHWNESEELEPEGPAPQAPESFSASMVKAVSELLDEYRPLGSRSDRLKYLHNLIRGSNDPKTQAKSDAEDSSRPGHSPAPSNAGMRILHAASSGGIRSSHQVITDSPAGSGQQPAQLPPEEDTERQDSVLARTSGPSSRGMFPAEARKMRRGVSQSPPHAQQALALPQKPDKAPSSTRRLPIPAASKASKVSPPTHIRRVRRPSPDHDPPDSQPQRKDSDKRSLDYSSEHIPPE